ncbi:hypothetical protein M408DRAFT_244197 [Serendipita vermifera MAFF 305830]|uniref:Uncharacterized protein n=1 Tax=Serendipita vermifera MAFF 305830 TaxID=933852 RepID=A0A0C3AHP5_SERVB|nr:hypothetical protein M408DRAFT_244197 [Serendipita vermifera MAFF 305830]
MFSKFFAVATLLFVAGGALAAPQASATLAPSPTVCSVPDYPAFKLFARAVGAVDSVDYPIRLLADSLSTSAAITHMVADTNSTCVKCGVTPSYWVLKNMRLYAVNSSSTVLVNTVNRDVSSGSTLDFITSAAIQPSYPIYCSQPTGASMPPVLAVHGTSKLFTMCAFTSVYPPTTSFSIVYDRSSILPTGTKCYPVQLIMQSIGIVPV